MLSILTYDEIRGAFESIASEIEEIADDDREFLDEARRTRDVCETLDDVKNPQAADCFANAFERVFNGVLDIATRIETMRDVRMSTADEAIEKLCGDKTFVLNLENIAEDVFLTIHVITHIFYKRFNAEEDADGQQ